MLLTRIINAPKPLLVHSSRRRLSKCAGGLGRRDGYGFGTIRLGIVVVGSAQADSLVVAQAAQWSAGPDRVESRQGRMQVAAE